MPLATDVRNRYSTQYIVELTNPGDRNATTFDGTRLQFAVDDVEALFQVYAGVVYDETNARHLAIAVEGVIAFLIRRTGQATAEARMAVWLTSIRDLGRVEGRNKVTPDSTTRFQPSADDRLTTTPRPAFDDRRFDPFMPKSPAAGG